MKRKVVMLTGILLLVVGIISSIWSLTLPGCNTATCLLIGDYSSPTASAESVVPTILLLAGVFILLWGRSIDNQFDKPNMGKGLYDDMKPEKM